MNYGKRRPAGRTPNASRSLRRSATARQRLECVELAPAFARGSWKGSCHFCACIGTTNHNSPSPGLWPPSPPLWAGERAGRGALFMESLLWLLHMHWDHEPTPNPSQEGNRVDADECLFPSWEGSGVGRFMERLTKG